MPVSTIHASQLFVQDAASITMGSSPPLDAARHLKRWLLTAMSRTAQTCHSATGRDAAVAARIADIRRVSKKYEGLILHNAGQS